MKNEEVDLQWHGPFIAAVWLEFKENRYDLEYQKEYNLNTMPLRIDLVVMLKPDAKKIENAIGEIFRKYNLMEYKSPGDELNVETFFKVIAYACLLRALPQTIGKIDENQITISLIREGYPRELMKYLKGRGFLITKKCEGIYYVEKEGIFPIQVIDTRKLDKKEHIWLTALTKKMNMQQAKDFYDALTELQDDEEIEYSKTIVDLNMSVNPRLYHIMKGGRSYEVCRV